MFGKDRITVQESRSNNPRILNDFIELCINYFVWIVYEVHSHYLQYADCIPIGAKPFLLPL